MTIFRSMKLLLIILSLFTFFNVKSQTVKMYKFNFITAYHQFYVADSKYEFQEDLWTEDSKYRLTLDTGLIGIQIESYAKATGEIHLLKSENTQYDTAVWDHIVEAFIEVKSGIIELRDSPNFDLIETIKIPLGNYGVRIYSKNTLTVVDPDDPTNDDFYRIELWPSRSNRLKLLKERD